MESCGTCKFYYKSLQAISDPAVCRRHPPSLVIPGKGGMMGIQQVPVGKDMWCGEWRERGSVGGTPGPLNS